MRPLFSVVQDPAWASMNMLHFASLVGFLAVFALTMTAGDRYQRLVAAMALAAWLAGQAAPMLSGDYVPLGTFAAVDVALLAGLAWLSRRHRRAWLIALVALQSLVVGADAAQVVSTAWPEPLYLNAVAVVGAVQLACLAGAVLFGRFGPPARPPHAG